MARVLVPLAEGCEELEAITIVDLLRRAKIDVVTAGLREGHVTASRGTKIIPDKTLDEALRETFDMVVLPGGMPGAQHLNEDSRIQNLVTTMATEGKFVGAICAAPMVLATAGILDGKEATSYPGFLDNEKFPSVTYTGRAVQRDGNIITSRSAGTAMDFALSLVEALQGQEGRENVEAQLVRTEPQEAQPS